MHSTSRRSMLKLALAGTIGAPAILKSRRAEAAEFTLKYANNAPLTHPLTVNITHAADAIRKATGGRVAIQVFPNNELGGDTDMLAQLRAGALDFFTQSPLILSTLVPNAAISGIGFAFKNYAHVWDAMDGSLGSYVRAQIKSKGLIAFPKIFDNGFRQITSSTHPIKTPADLKSFKIRVPPSPLWTSMFKDFGAEPLSIDFSEIYTALQTRIADGEENPLVTIDSAKLYEVQKYVAMTNHMWDGFWFLANPGSWNRLPPDVQKVIEEKITAAAVQERIDVARLNASLEKNLIAKGMAFNTVEAGAFQDRLQQAGFYTAWKARFGAAPWALLEKSAGRKL